MISEDKLYYILKFFEEKKIQQTKILFITRPVLPKKRFFINFFFLQQSGITGENPWKGEKFLKATALYRKY